MKRIYLLGLAALGLLAVSCQEDNLVPTPEAPETPETNSTVTIVAEMEQDAQTRTTVSNNGDNTYDILWEEGDMMSVFTDMGRNIPFTLSKGAGEKNGEFTGKFVPQEVETEDADGNPTVKVEALQYAAYPYHENHILNQFQLHLPAVYGSVETPYIANTNPLMIHFTYNPYAGFGSAEESVETSEQQEIVGTPKFSMKHAGGLLALDLKGIPANAKAVVLTTDKGITGTNQIDMEMDDDMNFTFFLSAGESDGTNNSVTIYFQPKNEVRNEVFHFPLPVGTYKFKIEYIDADDQKVTVINSLKENTIARAQLLTMPELVIGEIPSATEMMKMAIEKGGVITLDADYVFDEALNVNNDLTLNLGEYTITTSKDVFVDAENPDDDVLAVINVRNGANVTINATTGGLVSRDNDAYAIFLDDEATKVTVNGGTHIGNISSVYVRNGQLTINGGRYDVVQLSNFGDKRYLINGFDANFNAGTAKMTITGGEFVGFNPKESNSEYPETNFLPAGYDVVENEGVWTVVKLQPLYLNPGNAGNGWKMDNAKYIAHFWNNTSSKAVELVDSNSDGIYEVNVPYGMTNLLFARLSDVEGGYSWENWAVQTADLTVPTPNATRPTSTTNYYCICDYNNVGTWLNQASGNLSVWKGHYYTNSNNDEGKWYMTGDYNTWNLGGTRMQYFDGKYYLNTSTYIKTAGGVKFLYNKSWDNDNYGAYSADPIVKGEAVSLSYKSNTNINVSEAGYYAVYFDPVAGVAYFCDKNTKPALQ